MEVAVWCQQGALSHQTCEDTTALRLCSSFGVEQILPLILKAFHFRLTEACIFQDPKGENISEGSPSQVRQVALWLRRHADVVWLVARQNQSECAERKLN